jgi:hypothetical protein
MKDTYISIDWHLLIETYKGSFVYFITEPWCIVDTTTPYGVLALIFLLLEEKSDCWSTSIHKWFENRFCDHNTRAFDNAPSAGAGLGRWLTIWKRQNTIDHTPWRWIRSPHEQYVLIDSLPAVGLWPMVLWLSHTSNHIIPILHWKSGRILRCDVPSYRLGRVCVAWPSRQYRIRDRAG